MESEGFDYVIVGGGSAGCVAAARLAAAGSVLLLEAGDPATAHPESLSSDGFKYAFANDALMWHRMSAPQAHCGGRSVFIGTGRGMGGSGSVNGMVYTRGDRRDFDAWPKDWQWDDVVPAFEAVEARLGISPRPPTPFAEAFLSAATDAGFERRDHMNDGDLGGVVGCNDMNYAGDQRRSSYRAFLHDAPVPGLTIRTGATARRIVFVGSRAIAVEYESGGKVTTVAVGRELVLAAGALVTPHLLMISGVGPRAELQAAGVPLVLDAPGVGRNLQDHPNVCIFYRADAPVDFQYPQVYGFDAARAPEGGQRGETPDTCYVCYAAPASLQQSMQRMVPVLALPGRLYHARTLRRLLRGMVNLAFRLPPLRRFVGSIFGIVVILGKPTARGAIHLASADPAVPPRIDPAYYATEEDRAVMRAGIGRAHAIAAKPGLRRAGARPLSAGAKPVSEKALWKWVHGATMTTFHFCGSCRMGDEAESPLDTRLRVKGLANVRVADASAVPEIPVSALNAPSMMIAWRAADFILAEQDATATADVPSFEQPRRIHAGEPA
ncbi:GMC family oxidoreductase N-terminal domain-containing protein [Zavarzinia compransoris]|uniref:GMC family oxidoreductase n=1 Tax=Zavarzinia marina TaxID=2911065 RepID=UPI001F39AA05|nr:GMC family oxidoreductase N-terminal domain-containing protein [Zavarzinia marina]MCF4166683.1 GMC family oxidoreductase N-terminal domain-containing protein [Zavarzinia marina]